MSIAGASVRNSSLRLKAPEGELMNEHNASLEFVAACPIIGTPIILAMAAALITTTLLLPLRTSSSRSRSSHY
jgi:hypothetical protein